MKRLIDILKLIFIIILAFIMHIIVWWPYLCIIFILLFIMAKIHYLLVLIVGIIALFLYIFKFIVDLMSKI